MGHDDLSSGVYRPARVRALSSTSNGTRAAIPITGATITRLPLLPRYDVSSYGVSTYTHVISSKGERRETEPKEPEVAGADDHCHGDRAHCEEHEQSELAGSERIA